MKKFMRVYLNILLIVAMLCSAMAYASSGNEFDTISDKILTVLKALSWVGYAISLGMFLFIAAKYMLSAANDRAQVKQGLINYLIGALIIAAASTIAGVVSAIAAGNSGNVDSMATDIINSATSAAGIKKK